MGDPRTSKPVEGRFAKALALPLDPQSLYQKALIIGTVRGGRGEGVGDCTSPNKPY